MPSWRDGGKNRWSIITIAMRSKSFQARMSMNCGGWGRWLDVSASVPSRLSALLGIGVRGIVVHAILDDARKFYLALGFSDCPG
jgi:hypothetical protein